MKTARKQSENVYENKESRSLVAQTTGSAVCGFSMIPWTDRGPQTRRSALHQNRGNKARIYMKTKGHCVALTFGSAFSGNE